MREQELCTIQETLQALSYGQRTLIHLWSLNIYMFPIHNTWQATWLCCRYMDAARIAIYKLLSLDTTLPSRNAESKWCSFGHRWSPVRFSTNLTVSIVRIFWLC